MSRQKRQRQAGAATATPADSKILRDIRRGIELLIEGNLDPAEELFRAVLKRHRDQPMALHYLGMLLTRRGEYPRAAEAIRRAIKRDDSQIGIYQSLGDALGGAGDQEGALAAYRQAVVRAPHDADAVYCLARKLTELSRHEEADEMLREIATRSPHSIEVQYLLGRVRRELGKLVAARESFECALELDPGHVEVLLALAELFFEQKHEEDALPLLTRAVARAPERPDVHRELGRAHLLAQELGAAFESLSRARELDPRDEITQALFAWYHELRGEMEAAAECYRRCLELAPHTTNPYYMLARTGRYDDATRIEELLGVLAEGAPERCDLFFALGEIQRRRGDHAGAFASYAEGNRLARVPFDRGRHAAVVRETIELTRCAFFESRREGGVRTDAPIFIVGVPRSGTSLVEQILASHSGVGALGENPWCGLAATGLPELVGTPSPYPGAQGELSPDTTTALARGYLKQIGWPRVGATRFTDKAPGNFLFLPLIAQMFPEARIVHVRRHPLDTIISCFFTHFGKGRCPFSYDLGDLASVYRDYLAIMEHWREVLPLRMLEVEYEELVTEPERGVRELLAFAGLEWEPACLEFHRSENAVYTASRHQVRQPIYRSSCGRWKQYEAQLGPVIAAIPSPVNTRHGTAPLAAGICGPHP